MGVERGRRKRSDAENALRTVQWSWRSVTGRFRALPDFVVIGAQRAGTTSLFRTLRGHPHIVASFRKEVHYFDLQHRSHGLNWYRAHFGFPSSSHIQGEATPNYLAFSGVPQRMHDVLPEAKLVVLLRHPIERAQSAWRYRTRDGLEHRSFSDAIHEEENDTRTHSERVRDAKTARQDLAMQFAYLEKSRYAEHLERWLTVYPTEQLHIMRSEDLFEQPDVAMEKLMVFLDVDPDLAPPYPHANATTPTSIDEGDRRWLVEYFAPHNQKLEDLTGMSFGWE